ncbi:MAG: MmcQ/YjbR family DNA-binding protein [Planctomycetes bacterium]|nr:MmcQ/YjbR family DNA-binding protein [Planctomycetota bacterium]
MGCDTIPAVIKAMQQRAAAMPGASQALACNQAAFKVGGVAFLFVGPGAKGVGGKAMFKLGPSMVTAKQLAVCEPERFAVGSTGWVTVRFTTTHPLPKALWQAWLQESFELAAVGQSSRAKPAARRPTR